MQATEAIERLRAALIDCLREITCLQPHGTNFKNVAILSEVEGLIAATTTIDPPAAPVLAAVGVEAQQQGNAIRPSAEPAGQLDAAGATGGKDSEILALHRQLAAEKLRAGQGWQRHESANNGRNAALAALGMANARLAELTAAQSSIAGSAACGITNNDMEKK